MRIVESYYVKTLPARWPWITSGKTDAEISRMAAEKLLEEIKRHVDHGGAEVEAVYVCGHCGDSWTESREKYNGGCCAADESDETERRA